MSDPRTLTKTDACDEETQALAAAVSVSDADPRVAPHEEVRVWLLRLADGEWDAPPPVPR